MNGVHDMGGAHGFGPVEREPDEPLFHAAWEAHVRSVMTLVDSFNLDEFRYGIERMKPADYLRSSYFERWLASLEYNLIQKGILSSEELDARTEYFQRNPQAELPRGVVADTPSGTATREPLSEMAPRFAVGDAVIARNVHPIGHTRLPRYVRGKRGVIHLVHGPEIFPDTNAHGLGENPQVVYNVLFDGRELWGDSAEPRQVLSIDLWESYLEPASP